MGFVCLLTLTTESCEHEKASNPRDELWDVVPAYNRKLRCAVRTVFIFHIITDILFTALIISTVFNSLSPRAEDENCCAVPQTFSLYITD